MMLMSAPLILIPTHSLTLQSIVWESIWKPEVRIAQGKIRIKTLRTLNTTDGKVPSVTENSHSIKYKEQLCQSFYFVSGENFKDLEQPEKGIKIRESTGTSWFCSHPSETAARQKPRGQGCKKRNKALRWLTTSNQGLSLKNVLSAEEKQNKKEPMKDFSFIILQIFDQRGLKCQNYCVKDQSWDIVSSFKTKQQKTPPQTSLSWYRIMLSRKPETGKHLKISFK